MSAVRQIGIKMVVDAQSVTTEMPRVDRAFDSMASHAEQGAARTTRSLAQVNMSVRDIIQGAAGLHIVGSGINAITEAIRALPRAAFDYSKELETSKVGMSGILGSMTAINGQQLDYNRALQISSEYIRKLNDDALRTAASSQELTGVFQALLAPGISAKMTLEEIRQLTVVGTNAVKSMGLSGAQVVQELRDLVAGGITTAGSQLATALGLKDSDIAAAKASSEGLFKFLMDRLQGFKAASDAFGETLQGKLEQVKEGATRVAAQGMEPLITASKAALDEVAGLFVTIDENKNVTLNENLVGSIREMSEAAAKGMTIIRDLGAAVWENREAVMALGAAWAAYKVGDIVASTVAVTAAKMEATQASRLLTIQEAAESAGNTQVVVSSKAKIAAYLAELETNAARAQAEVANQAAQLATLRTTQEAIVVARAEVVAKMESVRATMAQAEAQIAAARAAGAQSMALALVREGTQALTAAQARHAVLMTELATLGRQQAGVQASITAATAAQTVAQEAAAASAASLAAAQGAASLTGRALSGVVGFLGGPIGIVTTALTLGATAWALWGSSGSSAEAKVQGAVERSTPEIIADLDKQIGKLRERNALVAAGLGDIAKQGGAAAERLGKLQTQIDNLQAGKGPDGGEPLPEEARSALLGTLTRQYGELYGKIQQVNEAQKGVDSTTGKLTLTVTGAEQAWRKSIDGIKTASSIQQEYTDKLNASKKAFESYEAIAKAAPGFDPKELEKKKAEQAQAEKALADERDKQIKSLSAGSASARAHGIDAEIAATKHGYKLLAAQTANSLAEVESLHKQGVISDSEALERRTTLQLADIDAQRASLQSEMSLLKGRKDSAKKQADVLGELAELEQKRANIEAAAARQQREFDAQAAAELEQRIEGYRANARQVQENLRTAQLDQAEIGKTGAALGELRQARVEEKAVALERQAVTMDGIDLSGQASEALRAEAAAIRELAKTQGYNESAKMVADYTRSVQESNDAVRYEQSLMVMSQRDREIALEQYRIAIDLKHKLEEIDAKNPADKQAAARLKADAEATAAQAKATAAGRVYAREMTRSVDQVNEIFRKGFADMVNRGEDTWAAFTKSLRTSFKTSVADEMYKAFAEPFVVPVIASIQGVIGSIASLSLGNLFGGGTNSAPGSGAGSGSVLDLIGAGRSLMGSNSMGGLMGSFNAGMQGGWAGFEGGMSMFNAGWLGEKGGSMLAGSAQMLGAAAPYIGGLIQMGQGNYGAGAGTMAGAYIGSIVPGIGTAIGAVIGGVLGGLFDDEDIPRYEAAARYEAGETSKGWTDSADWNDGFYPLVSSVAQGIGSALDSTAKLFGKDAGYTLWTAFSKDAEDKGTFGVLSISGPDGKNLVDWSQYDKEWGGRWFSDGDAGYKEYVAAAVAEVKSVFKTMGVDEWAQDLVSAANDLDTLQQAMAKMNVAQEAFRRFGLAMPEFAAQASAARSALVKESGGVDALTSKLGAFYSKYFSESERTAVATQLLSAEFTKLGLELPGSREEFRAMVTAAVEAGESGAKTAAGLLNLSDSFYELTEATKASAEANKKAAEEAKKAAQEALRNATDASFAILQKSIEAERTAAQARMDLVQERIDAEAALMDALRSHIDELRGEVAATRTMAAAHGNQVIDQALSAYLRTGYLPDAADIGSAVTAARSGITTDAYRSRLDYEAANLILANKLEVLHDAAGNQLTADELLLEQAKAQVDYLEQLLKSEKDALDIARGTFVQVSDVASILRKFREDLDKEKAATSGGKSGDGNTSGGSSGDSGGPVWGPGPSNTSAEAKYKKPVALLSGGLTIYDYADAEREKRLDGLSETFHSYDGTGDLVGLARDIKAKGGTAEDLAYLYGASERDVLKALDEYGIPHFVNGGNHRGGIRMVGENGPEIEITGPSRIYNTQQTQQLLSGLQGGGNDNGEVRQSIDALRRTVYDIGRQQIVLMQNMERLARKQDAIGIKQRESV